MSGEKSTFVTVNTDLMKLRDTMSISGSSEAFFLAGSNRHLVNVVVVISILLHGIALISNAQPANLEGTVASGVWNNNQSLTDKGSFRQVTIPASWTGTATYLFNTASGNYNPQWTGSNAPDYIRNVNTVYGGGYYYTGGGWNQDHSSNVTSGRYYTFNIQENATANNKVCVLETTYSPLAISTATVTQSPGTSAVYSCHSVTVTVTTSSAPSAGEYLYVRYTTNAWASSSLVQLTFTGSTGTAVIPSQSSGTTVQYYILSSNSTSGTIGTEYDMFTLDLRNNSGSNYSYTVGSSNVCVTSTLATTTGGYNTLKAAFDAINAGTHKGAITLNIVGNTSESATATLYYSGYLGTSSYTSVNIQPSGGAARTISGSIAGYLISLSGADNVTIDGLNSGGNSLTIDNPNTATGAATVHFVNDASSNTITNCTIKGSTTANNTSSYSGVIFFSSYDATLLQGNDNNTISSCTIRESSGGNPYFGIVSYQAFGGSSSRYNSGIQILNNSIINCYSPADASSSRGAAIHCVTQGSTSWTISGNSIYFTSSVTTTSGAPETYGIRIAGGNAQNMVISNNYIGGTAANCGGTALTFTNTTFGNKFCGICVNLSSSGTASSIQGNTISNIVLNTNSSQIGSPYVFCGISIEAGTANVGTTTGNVIGSSSSTGNISINVATNSAGNVVGIASGAASPSSVSIANNQIGGISMTGNTGGIYYHFRGIYITSTGAMTISGNTIGSTTTANSIQGTMGSSALTSAYLLGISSTSTTGVTITSNTIANLTYNASSNTLYTLQGVRVEAGTNSITNNNIYNLGMTNANIGSGTSASVVGILTMSTTPSTGEAISQNTIYNIQNLQSTNVATHAYGVLFGASGSGHSVSRNRIYDIKLSTSNSSTSSGLDAIRVTQGSPTISNNMISLGTGLNNSPFINAINIQGGTPAILFNSVVVTGGSSSTIANNCIRFQSANSGTTCINNILYNNRSTLTAGNGSCIYFASSTQVSNVTTCNYNSFYKGTGNNVVAYVQGVSSYSTLALWQAAYSKDANSIYFQPTFTSISTADLHVTASDCNLESAGIAVSVTVDYDGITRSDPPDIGADEFSYSSSTWTWTGATSTDWHTKSNWCPPIVPVSTSDVVIPSGPSNMPLIADADAVCHTININSGASLSMSNSGPPLSSRLLTIYANSTTGNFTNSGTFNAGSALETVVFDGTSTISGTTSTTFNQVISKTGSLTFNTSNYSTISKLFEIQSGGSVTSGAAPFYDSGSTLRYNTSGNYTAYEEWFPNNICASRGVPHHVEVTGNTFLNFGNEGFYREMCGDLTIASGSSFTLSSQSGGDLYIKGDWNDAGTFYPNCRMVKFNGTTADQTITKTGGGTETFNFLAIDKTGYKLFLGTSTDVKLQTSTCATNLSYLYMINGDLDLAGRTLYFEGPTSYGGTGATFMWLNVQNGNRTITSSSAAVVDVRSTYANKTLLVVDGGGSGRLIFDANITLKDATGEIDFGSGNLATVKGVFQVDNGGAATGNSAHYDVGSTLRFTNGNDYQVTVSDKTWADGITGDIGIPYHLEITTSSSSTDLIITSANIADHMIRGNLTITSSTLQLSTGAAGNLYIQGNWTRTNGSFSANSKRVVFQGTAPQTMTVNTASESFYGLEINNSSGLTLASGNANVSNALYLTSGKITTGTNEVNVTNTAGAAVTNHDTDPSSASYTSSSYVNGNLRRSVVVSASYDFPVGTASYYELATLNFSNVASISNVLANFTAGSSGVLGSCSINYTSIIGMLNGGFWTFTPTGATTNVLYDVTLYETGFSGWTGPAYTTGVIKRPNSAVDWTGTDFGSDGDHDNNTQAIYQFWTTAKAVRTDVPSFSDFAIGYSTQNPLPLELTTFTVSPLDDDALLTWATSSELNSDYFGIERSVDGIQFTEVGVADASGNSIMPTDYSFVDPGIRELQSEKIYYRLRMVDADGSFEYSAVRWLQVDVTANSNLLVYPNPFSDQLNMAWYMPDKGTTLLQLVDVSGKILLEKSMPAIEGSNFATFNEFSMLPGGVYFLHLHTGRSVLMQKVVKD